MSDARSVQISDVHTDHRFVTSEMHKKNDQEKCHDREERIRCCVQTTGIYQKCTEWETVTNQKQRQGDWREETKENLRQE